MNFLYANNISIGAGFARSAQVASNASAFRSHLGRGYKEVLIKPLNLGGSQYRLNESSILRKLIFLSRVLLSLRNCQIVYSRNIWLLLILGILTRKQLAWEMHDAPSRELFLKLAPKRLNVICISQALESWLIERGFHFRTMVAHDGISLSHWKKYTRIRKKNQNAISVVHTGSPFPGRGLEILFELAKDIPSVNFYHFGGTEIQLEYWKQNYDVPSNVHLAPSVSHNEVIQIQRNAGMLLLPMTKKSPIWWCTSPMKLFEYMASESLIVHTGIGSITEVLTDENSVKVDLNDLTVSFKEILSNYDSLLSRGKKARQEVYNNYLWEIRTKKILKFLNIPKI